MKKLIMLGVVLSSMTFSAVAYEEPTIESIINDYCENAPMNELAKKNCHQALRRISYVSYKIGYTDSLCTLTKHKEDEGCLYFKKTKMHIDNVKQIKGWEGLIGD